MIITKKYIDWLAEQDEDTRESSYNFTLLAVSRIPLFFRIMVAIEIILGTRFCLHMSKYQKPVTNEELVPEDILKDMYIKKIDA